MGQGAVAAVFYVFLIFEIAAAFALQHVERAEAEKAIEVFGIFQFVAGEILTFSVLKKFVVF